MTEDTDREILSVDLCDHGWKMAGASRRGLRDGNAGRVSVDGQRSAYTGHEQAMNRGVSEPVGLCDDEEHPMDMHRRWMDDDH